MPDSRRPRVIVGVDDSPGAVGAVRWAAEEAALSGSVLLIVHSPAPAVASVLASFGLLEVAAREAGSNLLLQECAAIAAQVHPELPIEVMLCHGPAVDTLVDLSAVATLIVLGTHHPGGNLVSLTGSVTHRVAVHARCPVAVVPTGGRRPHLDAHPVVVVGSTGTRLGHRALQLAFAQASRRGLAVRAVRARRGPGQPAQGAQPPADPDLTEREALEREALEREVHRELADLAASYPHVPATAVVLDTEPAEALLAASRDAELLVLGCHHSEDRWSSRLGPVPATVLHRTSCPLILIGTQH
jgi:nucleotide-binding universal stress UspA family protein